MARINIEDRLYRDRRFTDLCIRLGSKWAALGALAEAWTIAQDYVTPENPKGLIPVGDWHKKRACQDIITEGLGEITNGMVYMRGAEDQFAWLVAAQIKGRKGGLAKAANEKASSANPQLSPTYPLSPSLSQNSNTGGEENLPPPEASQVGVAEELRGNPDVEHALAQVPMLLQRTWIETYEVVWLRQSLARAVAHGIKRDGITDVAGIRNWQKRLDSWFSEERKPKFKPKPQAPRARAAPAEIIIEPVSREEALSNASRSPIASLVARLAVTKRMAGNAS